MSRPGDLAGWNHLRPLERFSASMAAFSSSLQSATLSSNHSQPRAHLLGEAALVGRTAGSAQMASSRSAGGYEPFHEWVEEEKGRAASLLLVQARSVLARPAKA